MFSLIYTSSKRWWGWWFETSLRPSWRKCNVPQEFFRWQIHIWWTFKVWFCLYQPRWSRTRMRLSCVLKILIDDDLTCVNIVKLERTGSLFAGDFSALIFPSEKIGVDTKLAVLRMILSISILTSIMTSHTQVLLPLSNPTMMGMFYAWMEKNGAVYEGDHIDD